ncbi:uncharacterized protein LOC107620156 [Arachis ipaensis]|uniref:uncharacterized protein LOC107620156 n=1 Tax=Arachis ipaensis TaxID=130454 RepID=UPI0007AFCD29|nr:uncharacterized protein LOC107620156 [Arachis ipaensis]
MKKYASDDGIYLSQAKYASDLLARAEISNSRTESTLLEPNVRFFPIDGTILDNPTLYRQLVRGLVYLVVTRPDIAYPIYVFSQFLSAPRTTYYAAILRILRYIKDTLFHGLHFLPIYLYPFRHIQMLIGLRVKKQTFTARSSTEAEYHTLADTTTEVVSIRWLLKDLGAPQSSPNDHLLIDTVHLIAVGTLDQIADIFTKAHHPTRFRTLVSKLKMHLYIPLNIVPLRTT